MRRSDRCRRFALLPALALAVLSSGLAARVPASHSPPTSPQGVEAQASCPPEGLNTLPSGLLRMPHGATPGATRLIVAIVSGDDGDADDNLKLGAAANREGIAVLYPTGRAGPIWQISSRYGSSDVQLVQNLLGGLLATGCFDTRRLAITGVSNGAGFAVRLACELPEHFAAVVAISAGYRALDPCSARASFEAIHGGADVIVPFGGRPPDYKGSVLRHARGWARRDGCSTKPTTRQPQRYVTRFDFGGCAAPFKVEVVLLHGTDHGWPGAPPPWPRNNPSGLDATLELLRFVRHASLPI